MADPTKKDGYLRQFLTLGFFLFALAFSAQAQYSPVVTSGSNGCSTVGTYTYVSDVNGKPSFSDLDENTIFWENNTWNLAFTGITPYYYLFENPANTPLPPCGEWIDLPQPSKSIHSPQSGKHPVAALRGMDRLGWLRLADHFRWMLWRLCPQLRRRERLRKSRHWLRQFLHQRFQRRGLVQIDQFWPGERHGQ